MSSVRTHVNIPPVISPSLPGFPIDANVCRNPACDNFGLSDADAKHRYRYTVTDEVLKYECKGCKQSHIAYSNLSVLESFHRCLPHSIPYASCPNPDCKNHHVNLFEVYHEDLRDKRDKLYRINVSDDKEQRYQARCRSCDKSFPLSQPLRLHKSQRRTWLKDIETFINAIVDGSGPSNIMNQMRVHPDVYYSHLRASSSALRDYNNLYLIRLMKGDVAPEEMQIYTDCIVCSFKMDRADRRYQQIKIIVSSCVQNKRSLILAFHPLFDQRIIPDNTATADYKRPLAERRLAYLKHQMFAGFKEPLPSLKIGGYFTDDFYTYLSHFLVLRKLLAKVPMVQFYMDGEASLYNTALTAFSDRVKARTCDVVVRKMDKNQEESQAKTSGHMDKKFQRARNKALRAYQKAHPDSKEPKPQTLHRFLLSEEMKRVNEAIRAGSIDKNGELFPQPLSRIYKTAIRRANTTGQAFWVCNELPNKHNAETRVLWLTRTPGRSNTEYELKLYMNCWIFYIDNVFFAMRRRSSLTARPLSTATGHKSYTRNAELPPNLIMDFTINVAFWNFFLKYRNERKETIAYDHGLVKQPGSPDIKSVFKPRLTFAMAKRISPWLGT